MANQRELELILRLRADRRAKKELQTLEKDLERIHKVASKAPSFAPKMSKEFGEAITRVKKLREELEKTSKGMRGLKISTESINVKGMTEKTRKFLEGLSKETDIARRATKQFGSSARESISDIKAFGESASIAADEMREVSDSFEKVTSQSRKVKESTDAVDSSFQKIKATLPILALTMSVYNKNLLTVSKVSQQAIVPLSNLEKKLRDLQVLGEMKGILDFSQGISGLKLFQSEIEKLRVKLAQVTGEKLGIGKFGITQEMIKGFRQATLEIEKFQYQLVQLPKDFEKMGLLEEKFNLIKESARNTKTTLNQLCQFPKLLAKETPYIQRFAETFKELRSKVVTVLTDLKTSFSGTSHKVKDMAIGFQEAMVIIESRGNDGASVAKKLERAYATATNKMVSDVKKFSQTAVLEFEKVGQSQEAIQRVALRQASSLEKLELEYEELAVLVRKLGTEFHSNSSAMEMANSLMKKAEVYGRSLASSERVLTDSIVKNTKALLHGAGALKQNEALVKGYEKEIDLLSKKMKVLEGSTRQLGQSEGILSKKVENARQILNVYTKAILELNKRLLTVNRTTKEGAKTFDYISKKLDQLGAKARQAGGNLKVLSGQLKQVESRGADTARAMERVTARGFANMIISQAAWMAGFQVVFGALDKFKASLVAVIDTIEAVTRAMRTARSEVMTISQVWDAYTKAMNQARVRTGTAIEELGEIMYQLGSAGLSAEESIAALDSTLANIIGTEANVRDITKLVAGVYNNFKDQIIKVNGELKTVSNTFDYYNAGMIEAATHTEKFEHINNLLVAAFRDNQVEMNELKDGLKMMTQSARLANVSLTEQIGTLAFLNNHLIKAGTAGRALRVIFSKLGKDAPAFAKAFDIEIDLQKPLDFFQILSDIHDNFKGQEITVEKIGAIFKRLGLRGAETFAVLIQKFDTLERTISKLEATSKDAASTMERIRLSSLSKEADIATAKIEGLMKTGLTPLAGVLKVIVVLFNTLADAIGKINSIFGGALGLVVKLGGALGVWILASRVGFTGLSKALNWVYNVFLRLFGALKTYGKLTEGSVTWTNRMSVAVSRLNAYLTMNAAGYNASSIASKQHVLVTQVVSDKTGILSQKTEVAAKKISKLSAATKLFSGALKTIVWIAAISALISLVQWFSEADERLQKQIEGYKLAAEKTKEYIKGLEGLYDSIKGVTEITDKNAEAFNELAIQTRSARGDLEGIKRATKDVLEIEKELLAAQTYKLLEVQLRDYGNKLKNVVRYGQVEVSFLTKAWAMYKEGIFKLIPPLHIVKKEFEILKNLWEKMFPKGKLSRVNEEFIVVSQAVKDLTKNLEEMEEKRRMAVQGGGGIDENLEKQIIAHKEHLGILEEEQEILRSQRKELMEMLSPVGKALAYQRKINPILEKQAKSTKEMKKNVKDWAGSLMKIIESTDQIEKLGEAFSHLDFSDDSVAGIDKFQEALRKMTKEIPLAKFNKNFEEVVLSLERVNELAEKEKIKDLKKEFIEFYKITASTMKEGVALLKEYGQEIINLEQKIKSLTKENENLSLKRFNIEMISISRSISNQTKLYSKLTSETQKYVSVVDSMVKSLMDEERTLRKLKGAMDAISKMGAEEIRWIDDAELGRISKDVKLALDQYQRSLKELGEEHYKTKESLRTYNEVLVRHETLVERAKKYKEDSASAEDAYQLQLEKTAIYAERSQRAEEKRLKQIGEGIQKIETMANRTESFLQREENARLSLTSAEIKADRIDQNLFNVQEDLLRVTKERDKALRNLQRAMKEIDIDKQSQALALYNQKQAEMLRLGNEEYDLLNKQAQAYGEYNSALDSSEIAKEKLAAVRREEAANLLKVQEAMGKEIERREKLQTVLEKQQIATKKIEDDRRKGIDTSGDTIEALEKTKSAYDSIEASLNSQIGNLKELEKQEKAVIDARQKAGELTAIEAIAQKQELTLKYDEKILEIQGRLFQLAQDQIKVNEELRQKQSEALVEAKAKAQELFDKLEELRKLTAEGISIMVKAPGMEEFQDWLTKLLAGSPYEILINVTKVITTVEKGEKEVFRGGLMKAGGGLIPARVTAGEGYIPPSQAFGNQTLLNTLNSGLPTSLVPGGISQFKGPGGIDNIPTYLPSGSYILSKKGMEAYERSLRQGAVPFVEGGEVSEEMFTDDSSSIQNMGSITINVQREGKPAISGPIFGEPSFLKKFKEELEEERLTRIH